MRPRHALAFVPPLRRFRCTVHVRTLTVLSIRAREQEFDRTMDFIKDTIKTYKQMVAKDNVFVQDGGVLAQIKRAPIGVMLNLGPFNYVRRLCTACERAHMRATGTCD